MKTILIIGLGRFGQHLCMNLTKLDNEIMAVDINEQMTEAVAPYVTSVKIGDCSNVEVLESLGIDNYDICFVCIGTNFQSSLEVTSLLKDMGAKYVVSKANRDIHAKFLLRNGADEVIYPDRDIAEKVAVKYSSDHVFNYIELSDGYNIYEVTPLPQWEGKSIRESDIAARYRVNIIGIKGGDDVRIQPGADYVIKRGQHLIIVGHNSDVEKILKKLE